VARAGRRGRERARGSRSSSRSGVVARRRFGGILALALLLWLALSGGPTEGPLDPAAFANGSCVAFAPTAGDRGETVFLDAGHGGLDPGGIGTTESGQAIEEARLTLPIELDAMALLRADGYRVVVSRTANTTVLRLGAADVADGELTLLGVHDDVAARAHCANLAGAKALVGIYFDASSASNEGSLTAYDPSRSFSAASHRLATLIQDDVLGAMNAHGWDIPDDGVQADSGLGSSDGNPAAGGLAALAGEYDHLLLLGPAMHGFFSTPSEMPGAVIEPLYITDPFEGSIAASADGQEVIARGIASAIERFLE